MRREKGSGGRWRKLTDMTIRPLRRVYQPPRKEICETLSFLTYAADGDESSAHRFSIRIQTYRGKIVDFSIEQQCEDGSDWHPVTRIDTKHGTIHRHQFVRGHEGDASRVVICDIPAGEGWEIVDKGYQEAYGVMHDEWEARYRRWCNG